MLFRSRRVLLNAPEAAVRALLPQCTAVDAMRLVLLDEDKDKADAEAAKLKGRRARDAKSAPLPPLKLQPLQGQTLKLQTLELSGRTLRVLEAWMPALLPKCSNLRRLRIACRDAKAKPVLSAWRLPPVAVKSLIQLELMLECQDPAIETAIGSLISAPLVLKETSLSRAFIKTPALGAKATRKAAKHRIVDDIVRAHPSLRDLLPESIRSTLRYRSVASAFGDLNEDLNHPEWFGDM